MRFRSLVPCLALAASAMAAPMTTITPPPVSIANGTPDARDRTVVPALPQHVRRSITSDVDAQVLAHLFSATTRSDFDVAISAVPTTCNSRTCRVAVTVRLPETTAPLRLSFAVANPKGELSDVKHADCLTSVCIVQLVLERGRNTIAVGASGGAAHAAGFATTQIEAVVPMSARKTEWF